MALTVIPDDNERPCEYFGLKLGTLVHFTLQMFLGKERLERKRRGLSRNLLFNYSKSSRISLTQTAALDGTHQQ